MLKNLGILNNYLTFAVEICWFTRFMGVTQRVYGNISRIELSFTSQCTMTYELEIEVLA